MRSRFVGQLALVLVGLIAVLGPAAAQRPAHIPRIGFLGFDETLQTARVAIMLGELRTRGQVEGRDFVMEYRWAKGQFERMNGLAAELAALPVDIIVTATPPGVRAAKQATSTIPIVIAATHEPVATGMVSSSARPGGNVTGLAFPDTELSVKQLQLLREAIPNLARVAVIWEPSGGGTIAVRALEDAAKAARLHLQVLEVREPRDLALAFAAAKKDGAQALLLLNSAFFAKNASTAVELLASYRLPASCGMGASPEEWCLISYGPSLNGMFRRAGYYVDRILKGAKAGELPMEAPREFDLIINRKIADSLGLKLAPAMLTQATQVLQ